jgi:glycerol-3-phosphate dehydrogenase
MTRDLGRLTARTFDVLVVGGGVYGLTIAYDCAQRGLSVALIDRGDFGSGASFNHLRTIHGGLRYLQTLDLRRARESLGERRTFARIAPDALRLQPFLLPLSRSLTRGKMAMRAGFALDRIVAFDRNRGVPAALRLPAGRVLNRAEAIRRFPSLAAPALTGAALWHDYVTIESDRLTFSLASAAAAHGADLANYVEAAAPLQEAARVTGVRAVDGPSGRTFDLGARVTVNAAGSGVNRWLGAACDAPIPLIKAMNLVTRREAGYVAVGGRATSGRNLFLVPWKNRALFGTWESNQVSDAPGDPGGPASPGGHLPSVTEGEVAAFIAEVNHAFPAVALTLADVTLVHRGLVPASAGGKVEAERHERIHDRRDGLITVAGTKYTTARAVAQRVTDLVFEKLGRPAVPCRTAVTPLPYVPEVQIVDAVRNEMVVTLADAVLRRTPLGALGCPSDAALTDAAGIVARELGWSPDRMQQEISDVRRFFSYAPLVR